MNFNSPSPCSAKEETEKVAESQRRQQNRKKTRLLIMSNMNFGDDDDEILMEKKRNDSSSEEEAGSNEDDEIFTRIRNPANRSNVFRTLIYQDEAQTPPTPLSRNEMSPRSNHLMTSSPPPSPSPVFPREQRQQHQQQLHQQHQHVSKSTPSPVLARKQEEKEKEKEKEQVLAPPIQPSSPTSSLSPEEDEDDEEKVSETEIASAAATGTGNQLLDTDDKIREHVLAHAKFSPLDFKIHDLINVRGIVPLNTDKSSFVVTGKLRSLISNSDSRDINDLLMPLVNSKQQTSTRKASSSSSSCRSMDSMHFGVEYLVSGFGEVGTRKRVKISEMEPCISALLQTVKRAYPLINSVHAMGFRTGVKYLPTLKLTEPELIPEYPIIVVSIGDKRRMVFNSQKSEDDDEEDYDTAPRFAPSVAAMSELDERRKRKVAPSAVTSSLSSEQFSREITAGHQDVVIIGGKFHRTHTITIPREGKDRKTSHVCLLFRAFHPVNIPRAPKRSLSSAAATAASAPPSSSSFSRKRLKRGDDDRHSRFYSDVIDDEAEEVSGSEGEIERREYLEDDEDLAFVDDIDIDSGENV